MKRFLLVFSAILLASSIFAQSNNSIYNKYSGKQGVSSVYISPSMFKMMKSLPEVEIYDDKDVHFEQIIKSFEGMYVIEVENIALVKSMISDVESMIAKGNLELLMEVKESDETVRIYVEKEGDMFKKFIMLEREDDSATFISIDAKMPQEAFAELLK